MRRLQELLDIELPIIQAPMAGVQGSHLTLAVTEAGALGSLPCAMLSLDAIRSEVTTIKAGTRRPFNINTSSVILNQRQIRSAKPLGEDCSHHTT